MSELFRTAKIVDRDEDGNIYEKGARSHIRPVVEVEPDYEAARPAMDTFIGWLHTRMVLHPNDYERFIQESIKKIVDAAYHE